VDDAQRVDAHGERVVGAVELGAQPARERLGAAHHEGEERTVACLGEAVELVLVGQVQQRARERQREGTELRPVVRGAQQRRRAAQRRLEQLVLALLGAPVGCAGGGVRSG
jgi:hypothetical protein